MSKILGLDLGTNSIGWALRETSEPQNQITDKGVVTFEKGVAEGKSGEFPMVQKRTESRGKRRNYQAEKYRKWALLETLIQNGMCPLTIEELDAWRKYKKGVGRKYPQTDKFIQWLRFDFDGDEKPDFERFGLSKHESLYVFRMLAAQKEETAKAIFSKQPHLLGRVFYQLVQRRGFRGRDEEESQMIMKGGGDSGAKGVNEITSYLKQYGTLGAALYHLQKETGERIRKRYNLRSDYEQELKTLCDIHELSEDLYHKLWKAIIWQRPLRSQKGLIGFCTLESPKKNDEDKYIKSGKKRCPVSHPFYEEYRTWVFINNLLIEPPTGINKERYLQEKVYPLFYNAARDFKLKKIADQLKKDGAAMQARFPDDTKVISCTLLNDFKKLYGGDWKQALGWNDALDNEAKKQPYNIEDVWHVLATFDSKEKLKEFAKLKLELTEESSEHFSKLKLAQGYATLSLAAIKKLLPYLQKGFKYSHAVYLANIHKVLGATRLDEEMANHLAHTFDAIEKEGKQQRTIDEIINSLIADHQNAEQRWGMDESYALDADDHKDVEEKIISVIGDKTWQERISATEQQIIRESVIAGYQYYLQQRINTPFNKIFPKRERLHDKIFQHLKDSYSLTDDAIKHLWHPSEQESYAPAPEKDGIKSLGDPQPISRGFKNPMALKTLHQLKKLLNYLLKSGKIDEDTRVVVEIARELNDANRRKAIERWQREREKQNEEFKGIIDDINKECGAAYNREDKTLLDKVRLWKEQNMRCLYTGKTINLCDLFNGIKYDFEHTIPASMSFDNELKNLTLADTKYNREVKKKRLPSECPNYNEESMIGGIMYTSIMSNIETIFGRLNTEKKTIRGKKIISQKFEKIEQLEKLLDEWQKKTSDDKGVKDAIIQRRHLLRMELEYWRKKVDSFIIKEYKAGWRNSQLRDTQVITKYALPYLKTVFRKVDVQKGAVTAAFREIYKVQPRTEKKDRSKHSHHAIDAAVLTLIPPPLVRDKILLRYNQEKDNNPHNTYHESVREWREFAVQHIHSIEDEVMINFQPQRRTLTQTYKNVRKRGIQQYLKQKNADGKWQYKLDDGGHKIPLKAAGNTIRGQLHNDSFFGAMKQPVYEEVKGKFIPQTDGRGNFIFQKNEKRGDELFFAVKPMAALTYITKPEDLDLVIDPNLRAYLKNETTARMQKGFSFSQAMAEPIWAFGKKQDKHGNSLNPIRNLRCRIKGGGGGLVNFPASIRDFDAYQSKKQYKRQFYALNGETAVCALYQGIIDGEVERIIQPYSILDIAKAKIGDSFEEIISPNFEKKIKKETYLIPLYAVLQTGQRVLFYENEIEELKSLDDTILAKRFYLIVKFEDGRISFKNHLNAMPEDELKREMKRLNLADVGASSFNFSQSIPKLRLSKTAFNFAIEGKHFSVNPDGQIKWLF
jgi:CRISPR-associated endonuclease Csn1